MTTDTLLPPNSTAQERVIEQALRPGADVVAAIELVRTAKESRPDDWLQWLIWEYGLQELLPYFNDQPLRTDGGWKLDGSHILDGVVPISVSSRDLIEQGIPWLRIRGTPESIRIALSWVALTAVIEEEIPTGRHWFEFQFNPGKIPTRKELRKLVDLARLSAPVGTRLSRIFYGYDYRRAIWDQTSWSDGTLYSDQSGVYDTDLDVVLSFGRTIQSVCDDLADESPLISVGLYRVSSQSARLTDRYVWDNEEYSDNTALVRNYRIVVDTVIQSAQNASVGRNLRLLDGSFSLDGSTVLSGGTIPERPQRPAYHLTEYYDTLMVGWGTVGWSAGRTWNDPADDA